MIAALILLSPILPPVRAVTHEDEVYPFPTSEIMFTPDLSGRGYTNSTQIQQDGSVSLLPETPYVQGAIWSKPEYLLDLTEDFRGVFHLQFGNKPSNVGDGMMFLLQGTGDFTPYTYGGGAMGALGSESHNGPVGMPNSFGIEFDIFFNRGAGDFDYYVGQPNAGGHHVAYVWPGERSTYQDRPPFDFFSPPRTLQHYDTQHFEYMANGQWYRLEVIWNARTEELTYQVNDLTVITVSGLKDKIRSEKVYWGFTGSAGSPHAAQNIIIKRVDGLRGVAEVTDSSSAFNLKTGREVKIIYPEDIVRIELDLRYQGGIFPWMDVLLHYTVDSLQYQPGTLCVVYASGEEESYGDEVWSNNQFTIPILRLGEARNRAKISFLAKVPVDIPTPVLVNHAYSVDAANDPTPEKIFEQPIGSPSDPEIFADYPSGITVVDDMEIFRLEGMWRDVNPSQLYIMSAVNDRPVDFEIEIINKATNASGIWEFEIDTDMLRLGENQLAAKIENSSGIGRTIRIPVFLHSRPVLDWGNFNPPSEAVAGKPLQISFRWFDEDSDTVRIFTSMNGADPDFLGSSESIGESTAFTAELSTLEWTLGENSIAFFAEDPNGHRSNTLNMTLDVSGALQFWVAPGDMGRAEPIPLSGKTGVYKIDMPQVLIVDTRTPGSVWQLKLRLKSKFTAGDREASFELFYRDPEGRDIAITTEDTVIMERKTTGTGKIELPRGSESGFFVRIPPGAYIGDYSASLYWTLI